MYAADVFKYGGLNDAMFNLHCIWIWSRVRWSKEFAIENEVVHLFTQRRVELERLSKYFHSIS
jgi:hypothetical protein